MWFTMYGIVTQTVKTHFHILALHFYSKAVLSLDTVIMQFKISCDEKNDLAKLKPVFVKEYSKKTIFLLLSKMQKKALKFC